MKHTIQIVFISLVALFGFNSCSKNNDVEEKVPEKLFGIWKYQYESTLIKNNGHTDTDDTIEYIDDVSKYLKIEADGTYSIYYIEYVTSSFSTKTELEWGTWKWKNKVLTFTADSIADEDGKSPIESFSIDLYDKSISLDNHKSYGTSAENDFLTQYLKYYLIDTTNICGRKYYVTAYLLTIMSVWHGSLRGFEPQSDCAS